MAIRATYQDGSRTIENAVIRLGRIWGSKSENWNAWVQVFVNEFSTEPDIIFSVVAPFVEGENPYIALYKVVGELSSLSGVSHDVAPQVEQPKEILEVSAPVAVVKPAVGKNKKKASSATT